jgi:hypothetical protein
MCQKGKIFMVHHRRNISNSSESRDPKPNKIARVICIWAQHLAKPEGNEFDSSLDLYMLQFNAWPSLKMLGYHPAFGFLF